MFTNLALARVAMVEPLEEAVLVHELDAAAAGARVAERVVLVAAVAADPAHVPLLVLLLLSGRRPRLLRQLARGGPLGDLGHGWLAGEGGDGGRSIARGTRIGVGARAVGGKGGE